MTSGRSRNYIRTLPIRKWKSFTMLFPKASPDAINFPQKTLTFGQRERVSVDKALEHPYLAT
ncbi:hypothetical protein EDC04DRAFT_2637872 [Pisolithus marmoratus]|nr:hypothetical protein EDC04DRAFT_2637872 [Pisolithus marmoratus]